MFGDNFRFFHPISKFCILFLTIQADTQQLTFTLKIKDVSAQLLTFCASVFNDDIQKEVAKC